MKNENDANSFRTKMRISKVMNILGLRFDSENNYLNKAYTIRNKVAHGGSIKDSLLEESDKILGYALNYLRLSLIVFILKYKKDRDEFIKMIDTAMIIEDENSKLNSYLSDIINEFSSSISDFNAQTMLKEELY